MRQRELQLFDVSYCFVNGYRLAPFDARELYWFLYYKDTMTGIASLFFASLAKTGRVAVLFWSYHFICYLYDA